MSSIIEYFKVNQLNYTTSSSPYCASDSHENAFDNIKYFQSTVTNPFWQIIFAQPVVIESYIISAGNWNWCTTEWEISYSVDGTSFAFLQKDTIEDMRGNTKRFPLKNKITCIGFKIAGIKASDTTDDLIFNSFDCFGSLKKSKNRCTCNCVYYKQRLISNFLLYLYLSFVPT